MENNDEIIRSLVNRVNHLEQEVIRLGGAPYQASAQQTPTQVQQVPTQPVQQPAQQPVQQPAQQPVQQPVQQAQVQQQAPVQQQAQVQQQAPVYNAQYNGPAPKKQNMENKIGKTLMGILASVLIFFSLILFAGIAFSYMSDIVKVVIMFAVSMCIAAVGIAKMPKKSSEKETKYKTFFTTLAACGIGAVYITDLVAYFGFKCLPLVPFIASLIIWILVTMFLAYKCSAIFVYICNLGLVIATIMTAVQFENSLLGFVLYTICLAGLYLMNRHEDFNKDCFYYIQYPVVFLILTAAVDTGVFNFVVFLILLAIVFVLANVLYTISSKQVATNIVTAVLNIAALIRIGVGVKNDAMNFVAIGLLLAIMAMYFLRNYKENRTLFYVIYFVTYFISVCFFLTTDLYILIALVPFVLFLLAGFILKDVVVRVGGYIAFFASFLIHLDFYESWFVVAIYLLVFVAAAIAVAKVHYTMADKYILTAILLIVLSCIIDVFDLDSWVAFALYAAVTLFMNLKPYNTNPKTLSYELAAQIIGYVICGMMILVGLANMFSTSLTPEIYQVIVFSLITLGLCLINTKNLYKLSIPEMVVGFYLCIKFSLWIYAILLRLEAASFVISIVGILVAIACIVLGFFVKQKSFRLYGLIISMVSVVKLILFDISYDSNILRPVGFFIAGVLCFAISFIYSRLEKSISTEEKTEEKIEEKGME